jgi:5-methylcytosine-specific restriction protein A
MKWMISANGKMYDHAKAFAKWGYIDWRQHAKYSAGDIVYIYCTKPYQKVMYKTKVIKANMPFSECQDDKEFWIDLEEYEKAKTGTYAHLELVEQVDSDKLQLQRLLAYGLKVAPQGPIKVKEQLSEYLDRYFDDYYKKGYFDNEPDEEKCYEGHLREVKVDKYERSSIARQKCIEQYGCKCQICGMDFEAIYGPVGKGFIHVHHLVPLYKIGKEYVVDYKKDLIPVCPNCHAMIHRLDGGEEMSVIELREKLIHIKK